MADESNQWRVTLAPPRPGSFEPAPVRTRSPVGVNVAILGLATLFFVDTFLAWQRACVSFSFAGTPISGCVSANAWTAKGSTAGLVAGLVAIALVLWEVLGFARVVEEATLAMVQRALVWALAAAGSVKWLLVLQHFAAPGAWIGFGLLVVLAGLDTFAARS